MEPRAAAKKCFKLVWWCHQLLSGFLGKDHLPRVACQSRLSANNKSDNEMIPGVMHRSPGIYLSVRTQLIQAVRPVIASNEVPYLQMRSVGSQSTLRWEKNGKKKRTKVLIFSIVHFKRYHAICQIMMQYYGCNQHIPQNSDVNTRMLA